MHVQAEASPGAEYEPVEPDLEDVYFSVMAGHHGRRSKPIHEHDSLVGDHPARMSANARTGRLAGPCSAATGIADPGRLGPMDLERPPR